VSVRMRSSVGMRRKSWFPGYWSVIAVIFAMGWTGAPRIYAQIATTTASISGAIADPSGAVVPGACAHSSLDVSRGVMALTRASSHPYETLRKEDEAQESARETISTHRTRSGNHHCEKGLSVYKVEIIQSQQDLGSCA